jgi:hypothetical protein
VILFQTSFKDNRPVSEETMSDKLMCPYCLAISKIELKKDEKQQFFSCLQCSMRISSEYMNYPDIHRDVVSAVGFRGHGKTVYFASLFNMMNDLANYWPGFYTLAADETSLDIVKNNSRMLKAGDLPVATPMNFPTPTIVKFSNMPKFGERFFLFYDTSGEAYARQSTVIQHASFVKRSNSVIFLISLDDLERDDQKMHELLSAYVQGLTDLKGDPKNQNLIVVFSKGDRLKTRLENYKEVWRYLEEGRLEMLGNGKMGRYIRKMNSISQDLKGYVKSELKETQFLNLADDRFKSIEFSIISALGTQPSGSRLDGLSIPKRIMDPLLWVIYKSKSRIQRSFI